jgi:hypothetical protein
MTTPSCPPPAGSRSSGAMAGHRSAGAGLQEEVGAVRAHGDLAELVLAVGRVEE